MHIVEATRRQAEDDVSEKTDRCFMVNLDDDAKKSDTRESGREPRKYFSTISSD